MTIRVGTAGWTFPRTPSVGVNEGESHLQRYAAVFNACEINSSFYRPHKPATWTRWAKTVPKSFRFSVKMPRAITHEACLACGSAPLGKFLRQLDFLEDRLGPILVQLPPGLAFDWPIAQSFVSLLREMFEGEVVCEPRHPSWFSPEAESLLNDYAVARCAADPPCVLAGSSPAGSNSVAYFRLHGSPQMYWSSYGGAFLRRLAEQLLVRSRSSSAWCIFRQHRIRSRAAKCRRAARNT